MRSGRIGGQLLAAFTGSQGQILVISEHSDQEQARKRVEGLLARLTEYHSNMALYRPNEEEKSICYSDLIPKLLLEQKINGIFCTSGINTISAGRILRSFDRSDVPVIGFDLSAESSALLQEGWIQAILDQRPETHAYQAVKVLFSYITEGSIPDPIYTLPITIYTSECLPISD